MALILNIETATKICSVSLSLNGKNIISKEYNGEDFSHSKLLTVFIEELFSESDFEMSNLQAISVSKGPGSYTGLRIGVSTAKGIAYALEIPLISVNTLLAMTWGLNRNLSNYYNISSNKEILFCPMLDARRMEVYTSIYNSSLDIIQETNALIVDSTSFNDLLLTNTIIFFGDGAEKCKNIISNDNAVFIDNFFPSANFMAKLSEESFTMNRFENVAYFEPFYLKDFMATVPKKNIYG